MGAFGALPPRVVGATPAVTDLLTGTRLVTSLVGILVIAVLASRLLGARRSLSSGDDVRVLTRWLNRVILAFLGGVVGIMSVILIGIKGGPDFTGQTSLYEFFGYFGLFCSSILIMRVLISVFRDGLN